MDWAKPRWPVIRKIGTGCFIAAVLILLGTAASQIEWAEVLGAIRKLPGSALWTATLLTAISYFVYSSFDLLGKWYTEHSLAWWRAMMVGFISYAFTMTLGAPIGGVGLRLRLYTKQGLAQGIAMRILALSLATNWIGYLLLAGSVFAAGAVRLPLSWEIGSGALRLIGAAMCMAGVAYLVLCAFSSKRSWTIHGHEIELPSIGLAAVQIALAILNWALIAGVIYVLFQQKVDYLLVIGALLVSAIAGVIAHVPGGLGVIESVFIALLFSALPRSEILGGLLVYRALYYLAPLLIAGIWYLAAEAKMNGRDDDGSPVRYTDYTNR